MLLPPFQDFVSQPSTGLQLHLAVITYQKMDPLEVLENRICALENKVLGNKKPSSIAKPLADTVVEINNQVTTALANRDSINAIMKRLEQLEDYLDPTYGDRAVLTSAAKLELVHCAEPELRKNLASLEMLSKSQSSLNSEHIRAVPDLSGKLEKLTCVYIDNKEKVDAQTVQIHQLLKQYNDIVTTLSSSFVQWDQLVTDAEMAAKPKKSLD